jgi:anti-sigma regulatory factor (Ser/Thr protein kinase)
VGDPDINVKLEDRPSHGLGLFFIRQWMDRVEFEFKKGNGNRLTLFKKRQDSPTHKNEKKR